MPSIDPINPFAIPIPKPLPPGSGMGSPSAHFLSAVNDSASLRTTMLRYVQTFIIQTADSAISNAHQPVEARLARWLLM